MVLAFEGDDGAMDKELKEAGTMIKDARRAKMVFGGRGVRFEKILIVHHTSHNSPFRETLCYL